ncbi:unnamed protein product [Periconia digitata]|uniref:NmrA-like domain-containing protein n=1 Tax=Periconia digitata TaxID=1303443 RepID=A0A9W4UGV8_9PLEO|nr:unnamed protein product [Periconia digitata]
MSQTTSATLPTLFITGALGYIGGTFLTVLKRSHPSILVRALVRDESQAETLSSFYGWTVTPVIGRLDDLKYIQEEASKADIVIQATGDNREAVMALLNGTTKNPKHQSADIKERPIFMHIAGASNVGYSKLGENSPRVWSDVDDWEDIKALDETRIGVRTDNAIRKFSAENNVRALVLSPPTILGRGLGAGKTETHQRTMYDLILEKGSVFLGGAGTNAWSTISIEDLGRACVFLLNEAMKGNDSHIELGENGYYFIEAFELSLAERAKAFAERLYSEGKIATSEVGLKTMEEFHEDFGNFGEFASYLFCSSSRVKADKLRKLGWRPVDYDWLRMVQEAPGYRI